MKSSAPWVFLMLSACAGSSQPRASQSTAPQSDACAPIEQRADLPEAVLEQMTWIYSALRTHFERERLGPDGQLITYEFPESLPKTPSVAPCRASAWPPDDELGMQWRSKLGLYEASEIAGSFELRMLDAQHGEILYYSDDDCDGTETTAMLRFESLGEEMRRDASVVTQTRPLGCTGQ